MADSAINVVVVDDDESMRLMLSRFLTGRGYSTTAVSDGSAMMERITTSNVDVVLLDMHLGEVSGIDLLSALFDAAPQTIVIMISADSAPENIFRGLFEGADDFLIKPVLMDELEMRIRNLVRKRKYLRDVQQAADTLERERRLLLRYFSPQTAEHLLSGMIDANLRGGAHDISVLFFGMKNVASALRIMSAADFAQFLNDILADIMDYVSANNGAVNKVTGAGLLATFGLPFPESTNASNAVKCARSIQQHILAWNEVSPPEKTVTFGLGIASGSVFAGNIGSDARMEYSVIGDTVNVAARLEAMARAKRNTILSDLWTVERAGLETAASGVTLRGRKGEIAVCEL